ncbi:MAG: hypothetical protein L0219_21955 [Phycisphaerales bacterium]|nr:hypothetical protein [Phycisphaerales bacterium]
MEIIDQDDHIYRQIGHGAQKTIEVRCIQQPQCQADGERMACDVEWSTKNDHDKDAYRGSHDASCRDHCERVAAAVICEFGEGRNDSDCCCRHYDQRGAEKLALAELGNCATLIGAGVGKGVHQIWTTLELSIWMIKRTGEFPTGVIEADSRHCHASFVVSDSPD